MKVHASDSLAIVVLTALRSCASYRDRHGGLELEVAEIAEPRRFQGLKDDS
jgi:hypothetical protein